MQLQQFIEGDEPFVTYLDTDDESTVVADFGAASEVSVDTLDGLALVTVDGETTEIDLPSDAERAFIKNGVLTIELEEDA